jgi:YD repeat-containing protein
MSIKEILIYKTEYLLTSTSHDYLEEREYLLTRTLYNPQGKVLTDTHYNPEGEIIQQYSCRYNPDGFLTEEKLTEDDGLVAEHRTFEPDEHNRIKTELCHYLDGSFDTIRYAYNHQGQLAHKQTIDPDGHTESTEEFTYENGFLTHYVHKDASGQILSEKTISCNPKGEPLEETLYDGDEDTTTYRVSEYHPSGGLKETRTYDQNNKLVAKAVFTENENGKLTELVEETHRNKSTIRFTYDQAGNITCQEEFDRNGELHASVTREYDEQNNLLNSRFFVNRQGKGLARNYSLRQETIEDRRSKI